MRHCGAGATGAGLTRCRYAYSDDGVIHIHSCAGKHATRRVIEVID